MIVRPTQELQIIVLFNIFVVLNKIQINLIHQNWKLDSNAKGTF